VAVGSWPLILQPWCPKADASYQLLTSSYPPLTPDFRLC